MATWSGDVDAGAIVHLLRAGLSVDAIDRML
jgi:acetate kinase